MISDIRLNSTAYAHHPRGPVASSASPSEPREKASAPSTLDLPSVLQATSAEAARIQASLPDHASGEVLVKLSPGLANESFETLVKDYNAKLIERFDVPKNMKESFGGELIHLKLPAGMSTAQAMAALEQDGRVDYACSNDILKALDNIPNDLNPKLWGMHNTGQTGGTAGIDIDAPAAWSTSTGNGVDGPVICVVDTGIDYNHPDLKNNIWTNPGEIPGNGIDDDGDGVVDDVHGYNAINDSGDPMDDHNHGTHCAGTIAAEGNNGQGVVGVNWHARVMAAKFLGPDGQGTTAGAVKALLYASKMGARITSNSWGGGGFNQALYDALKSSPCLHIFAAGNDGKNNDKTPFYPASFGLPNIVSVAAIDSTGRLASFSNYGAKSVDLAAPGVSIYSTLRNGAYGNMSGTSMATPHVAGVAGLVATVYPKASNAEIKERLLGGTTHQSNLEGKMTTGGRLNAALALHEDTTPPAAPHDLTAQAAARHCTLSWKAPGDDGDQGQAFHYDLRWSAQPIADDKAFDEAQKLDTPRPLAAGTLQTIDVPVPATDQPHSLYFAMRAIDHVGNRSPLASVQAQVPAAVYAFADDADGGPEKWTAEGTWAQVAEAGRGKVWTDSPQGNYENKTKSSLISQPFSLAGTHATMLSFDSKYEFEPRHDFLHVEVQKGDSRWKEVAAFTGHSDWQGHTYDLSKYDGESDLKVRFRMDTDKTIVADGFYLDNVLVSAEPGAAPAVEPTGCGRLFQ